jgi:hypothetical protein
VRGSFLSIDLVQNGLKHKPALAQTDPDRRRPAAVIPFLLADCALVFLKGSTHQVQLFVVEVQCECHSDVSGYQKCISTTKA